MSTPTGNAAPPNFRQHTRVSFGGTLQGVTPNEIWQCNVAVADFSTNPSGAPLADPGAYMVDIASTGATTLKTWFQQTLDANGMSNQAHLDWVKVNNIDVNGKYLGGPSSGHTFLYGASPGIGVKVPGVPYILCGAVSWKTASNNKRGLNGRVYLPLAFASNAFPIMSVGEQQSLRDFGTSLLTLLARANFHATPVVASRVDSSLHPIIQVRAGNVMDVQRRRKDRITESYIQANWP